MRKNGKVYYGPLNFETRKIILEKVKRIGEISEEEGKLIYNLWKNMKVTSS